MAMDFEGGGMVLTAKSFDIKAFCFQNKEILLNAYGRQPTHTHNIQRHNKSTIAGREKPPPPATTTMQITVA